MHHRPASSSFPLFWRGLLAPFGLAVLLALTGCDPDNIAGDKVSASRRPLPLSVELPNVKVKPDETTEPDKNMPTEAEIGIPFYPGAKPVQGPKGSLATTKSYGLGMTILETPDSIEKVIAFYKERYPPAPQIGGKSDGKNAEEKMSAKSADWSEETQAGQRVIHCSISDPQAGNALRSVQISAAGDKTHIELLSIQGDKTLADINAAADASLPKTKMPETGLPPGSALPLGAPDGSSVQPTAPPVSNLPKTPNGR